MDLTSLVSTEKKLTKVLYVLKGSIGKKRHHVISDQNLCGLSSRSIMHLQRLGFLPSDNYFHEKQV